MALWTEAANHTAYSLSNSLPHRSIYLTTCLLETRDSIHQHSSAFRSVIGDKISALSTLLKHPPSKASMAITNQASNSPVAVIHKKKQHQYIQVQKHITTTPQHCRHITQYWHSKTQQANEYITYHSQFIDRQKRNAFMYNRNLNQVRLAKHNIKISWMPSQFSRHSIKQASSSNSFKGKTWPTCLHKM